MPVAFAIRLMLMCATALFIGVVVGLFIHPVWLAFVVGIVLFVIAIVVIVKLIPLGEYHA